MNVQRTYDFNASELHASLWDFTSVVERRKPLKELHNRVVHMDTGCKTKIARQGAKERADCIANK